MARRAFSALALKNMAVLSPEFALALRYLKTNNAKRFLADADSSLLFRMRQAFLLKTDDPNLTAYSTQTYYVVPNYVWNAIDAHVKGVPAPPVAPWVRMPDGTGWIRG